MLQQKNSPGFSKDGRSQDTAPSAPAEAPAPAPAPAPVPTEAAELPRTSRVKKFHVGIPGWKKAAASVTRVGRPCQGCTNGRSLPMMFRICRLHSVRA